MEVMKRFEERYGANHARVQLHYSPPGVVCQNVPLAERIVRAGKSTKPLAHLNTLEGQRMAYHCGGIVKQVFDEAIALATLAASARERIRLERGY